MKRFRFYFVAVLVLLLSSLACRTVVGDPFSSRENQTDSPQVAVTVEVPSNNEAVSLPAPVDLLASQDTLVNLYESAHKGVVAIRVLTEAGQGLGSGFVIDKEGHVVTNYHVVENQTHLEVAFASGYKARGEVIGTDLDSDLAVVRVDASEEELFPLKMGDSDSIRVGQTVIAIGNPFGLAGTMTLGIVSGLGRTMPSLHTTADGSSFTAGDIIQTDTAINPGNSGGPLLNLAGEVIGVNQAIRTTTFSSDGEPVNSGVGFAVSINIAKRVVPHLIAEGKYDYPYLGIFSTSDLTLLDQEALGLPRSTGVYVTSVSRGGPADRAGVRGGNRTSGIPGIQAGGDLIIGIDGQPVLTFNDLIGYLVANKSPGDTVVLTILRDGEEINLELTLDKRPSAE